MSPNDFGYLSACYDCLAYQTATLPVTYPEFAARWQPFDGAERANYSLFLTDLCDLIGVPRPDAEC